MAYHQTDFVKKAAVCLIFGAEYLVFTIMYCIVLLHSSILTFHP